MSILQTLDIYAGYEDVTVIKGLTIEVDKGELVALVGSNGAGKSTLLRAISGLIRCSKGSIILNGANIEHMAPHQIVELGFTMVPEGKQLFSQMTVEENLMVGSYNSRAKGKRTKTLGEVYELFPRLKERRGQMAWSLSGGEQQMLAVGRALMSIPIVLALDEPSLGLAPIVVDNLFKVIGKIRDTGLTVMLIEQNVQQTLEMANRGYVIENGHISIQGPGMELLQNEHLKTTYMGI